MSPQDFRSRYNLCLARCLCGESPGTEDLLPRDVEPDERERVAYLLARLYHQNRRFTEAVRVLTDLGEDRLDDSGSVLLADTHASLLDVPSSLNVLRRAARRSPSIGLAHALARRLVDAGLYEEAEAVYSRLCRSAGATRQLHLELARLLIVRGGRPEAFGICTAVVNQQLFGIPVTPDDFYWHGCAKFIIGELAHAEYDFGRSGNFGPWYAEWLEDDFVPCASRASLAG